MSSFDWLDEDEWYKSYRSHFLKDVLPMLDDAAFSISIVPSSRNENHRGDVKYWTELGASIMYDKPILAVVEPGAYVPERLRRVADVLIEADITTDEGREQAQEQIAVAIAKFEEEKS